uniref:Uncharacterized protein n=1 Tax=Aegilops tauschii subsp. strangulata TaxID=200361 RepID=A0A453AM22_AEGTS
MLISQALHAVLPESLVRTRWSWCVSPWRQVMQLVRSPSADNHLSYMSSNTNRSTLASKTSKKLFGIDIEYRVATAHGLVLHRLVSAGGSFFKPI